MAIAAKCGGLVVPACERDEKFVELLETLAKVDPAAYEALITLLLRVVHEK